MRADARRNLDALVDAARQVFADQGVDAPAKVIADLAGVGVGTLYRHFPQRSDLVVAVFQQAVEECADAAADLADHHEPDEASRSGSSGSPGSSRRSAGSLRRSSPVTRRSRDSTPGSSAADSAGR